MGVAGAVDAVAAVADETAGGSTIVGQGRIVVVAVGGSVAVAASCKTVWHLHNHNLHIGQFDQEGLES